MIHETRYVIGAIRIGLGATLLIDLWSSFLRRVFDTPSLNNCLLGRWLLHMPGGTFVHRSITAARLTSVRWLERPTLLPALAFNVATTLVPYLIAAVIRA